jgi:DNA-binding MltR family transcriptional regulator
MSEPAKSAAAHWNSIHNAEFAKESDRAAVILTAAMLDNALYQLLRTVLVADTSSTDELLEGANAPLSTFSSRIHAAYRLGLLSKRFARDLHLVRNIRNAFAHNITGCAFDEGGVRSRVTELGRSLNILVKLTVPKHRKTAPETPREQFQFFTSWMLYELHTKIAKSRALEEAPIELGYDETVSAVLEQKEQPKQ